MNEALAALAATHPALLVFLLALVTALATGLGALPFAFLRTVSPRVIGTSNAIAAGLMMGATFGLLAEGSAYGGWQTLIGANLGIVFVAVTSRLLGEPEGTQVADLRGVDSRKAVLIVAIMTVHSVAEGVAVGAAFAGGIPLATFITIAIAIHNIPEGLAISAVLRPRGRSIAACAGWSVTSSLPQPIMAVPAFLFVEAFRPTLPYAMGFAGGAMVLMVLGELLPEAYEEGRRATVAWVASASMFAMVLFQQFL